MKDSLYPMFMEYTCKQNSQIDLKVIRLLYAC